MKLDPITTEVIISRIRETTAAMAHALFHSGYSPILRESQDGTAGLCDADGRVIMVGGGLQYHSLLYTRAVESVRERYPLAEMRDGDSFISNDPYKAGNSHVPDVVVITPVFYGGKIIAFGASVAHKADVGGLVPGSSGAAAREIFHDGVLIPPVRYWTKDGVNREVEAILRNNSRVPEVVIGDLRGQVGSTRLGAERLCALCDGYGAETMHLAMESLLERTAPPDRPGGVAACRGRRLRPDYPHEFRRARCGRFRHAAGHVGQPTIPCIGESLFSDVARRLHLRARGTRQVQSRARGGARRFRDRSHRDRIHQGPRWQADGAIRIDGDVARRHEHARWNFDRACHEPFHAGHAGRNHRDRVSGDGAALRHLARFGWAGTPSWRHRERARISIARRLYPHGPHVEPSARRVGAQWRRTTAAFARDHQSRYAAGGRDGLHGDARGSGRHCGAPRANRRWRLWRSFRATERACGERY